MKRLLAAAVVGIVIALSGCGGGSSPQPTFVADILSDPAVDGDIARDTSLAYTVTQGMTPTVQSVFAGIDPATGTEYRAFLDFPLTKVPVDAVIASAVLDLFINSIKPVNGTIPIRIELVSFQPPTLLPTDFERTSLQPLAFVTITPPIDARDVGTHVNVDVTPLMAEAQRLRLANFQVRILEDLGPVFPGFMEINDTTGANRATLAPLLSVTYF